MARLRSGCPDDGGLSSAMSDCSRPTRRISRATFPVRRYLANMVSSLRFVGASALVLLGGLVHCGGGVAAPAAAPPLAWGPAQPTATLVIPASPSGGGQEAQAWAALANRIEAALVADGYNLVPPEREHELTFEVQASLRHEGGSWECNGASEKWSATVTLRVRAKDRMLDALSLVSKNSRCATPDGIAIESASALEKSLRSSPSMIAFAKRRSETPAQETAASTASSGSSPTPPPAQPGGATTAAPPPPPPSGTTFISGAPQPNSYAVVIGIERYSAGLPPPTGARGRGPLRRAREAVPRPLRRSRSPRRRRAGHEGNDRERDRVAQIECASRRSHLLLL